MSEPKIKLLEERVFQAVAQVRSLREERDRVEGELREVRQRLEELEGEGVRLRLGFSPDRIAEVRGVLEAAIRELRNEDEPTAAPEGGASAGEGVE
jgi:DNA-binding Lrp family transcriptional regulator